MHADFECHSCCKRAFDGLITSFVSKDQTNKDEVHLSFDLETKKITVGFLCSEDCHQLVLVLRYLPYREMVVLLHWK